MSNECEHVDLDYFRDAPFCFDAVERVQASPERIFEVWLDGPSWTTWVFAITGVEWTSPFPLDVGSTRTVTMLGGLEGHEEFIAWDPPRRMAFRFNSTNKPVADAFAEDYRVTDLGGGYSEIHWRMAMTPSGPGASSLKILKPVMAVFLRDTLRRFRRYVESDPVLTDSH